MKKLLVAVLLLTAGCQLPFENERTPLSADAYLERVPAVKTAVVHLTNPDMSTDDIEYKQLFVRLKPILEEKGYRFVAPSAVILRLDFGVKKDGVVSVKSTIDTAKTLHPVDEPSVLASSQYDRKPVYEKYISLTAVQAGQEKRPLWKVTVSQKDYASDFRSSRDRLLYLLAHFIEKDSGRMVTADLSDAEFYQRYVLKYSAAESSSLFSTKAEAKRQYERRLQQRVNARIADFRKCGLTEKREVSFAISPFGTLPAFDIRETFSISGSPVSEKVRDCLAKELEPLLDPPHGIDTNQPFAVEIPIK